METFFDEVFTPGFAYEFVNITKTYAYPRSLLKKKKIRCYLTHGAPSLPVKTIYLNSVKLRLVLGVFTFVFGWGGNWSNTKQFWSVPFVSEKKRMKYLRVVEKDLRRDCKKWFAGLSLALIKKRDIHSRENGINPKIKFYI